MTKMKRTEFEHRVIDFCRKSDGKVYPAEVRKVPSRFSADLADETITVVYVDAEDSFKQKEAVLNYKTSTTESWDWENDTFECTYVVPEATAVVAEQTPRGASPILEKGTKMTIAT